MRALGGVVMTRRGRAGRELEGGGQAGSCQGGGSEEYAAVRGVTVSLACDIPTRAVSPRVRAPWLL